MFPRCRERDTSSVYDDLFGVALRGAGTVTFQIFSCNACILPYGRRYYAETELQYASSRNDAG
jgi:hypothetical protein